MGRTSSTVHNRYNDKAYDRIQLVVPKGRKADVDAHAKANGTTINGLINDLLRESLCMSVEKWKEKKESDE